MLKGLILQFVSVTYYLYTLKSSDKQLQMRDQINLWSPIQHDGSEQNSEVLQISLTIPKNQTNPVFDVGDI